MTQFRLVIAFIAALLASAVAAYPTAPAAAPAVTSGGGVEPSKVLVFLKTPPPHFRPNADYGQGYADAEGRAARRRVAGRLARQNDLALADDWPLPLLGVDCYVMIVPTGRSASDVAVRLSRAGGVAWAEPLNLYQAKGAAAPNDPLFRVQPAARQWRLADLHELATGRNVTVAVVDSGIERSHPDLKGQVAVSEDFATGHPGGAEQHGTGVAGVIAAIEGNGVGIVGVAPRASLMGLRACWQQPAGPAAAISTFCDSLSLAKALHYAVDHDARVINLSLGGPPDAVLGKLIDLALARGATVVAAFDPTLPGGGFPASHAGVVAVADDALDAVPAGVYSAPGRDVPTTQTGGRWSLVNGSSFAAAHVSGLFALIRQRAPTAHGGGALVAAPAGRGAIDACATLLRATGPCDCACAKPPRAWAAGS